MRNSHASFTHNSRLITGLRLGERINSVRRTRVLHVFLLSRRFKMVQGNVSMWRDAVKTANLSLCTPWNLSLCRPWNLSLCTPSNLSLYTPWSRVECAGVSPLIVTGGTERHWEDSCTPPGPYWIGLLGPRADWATLRERKILRLCRDLKIHWLSLSVASSLQPLCYSGSW